MNAQQHISEFKDRVRNEISEALLSSGFTLVFDNLELGNQEDKFIFKLVFSGPRTIEISNKDWRDYTEYFHVSVNQKEVKIINLLEAASVEDAINQLRLSLGLKNS